MKGKEREPYNHQGHKAAEPQPKTESRIAKIAITAKIATIATIENHQQNLYNTEVTKYTEGHRGICEKKQDFKSPRSTKEHEGFSWAIYSVFRINVDRRRERDMYQGTTFSGVPGTRRFGVLRVLGCRVVPSSLQAALNDKIAFGL